MPAPGFILGHNFWMGSSKGCAASQKQLTDDFQSRTSPFDIDYRMVYAEHRSPCQVQVEFQLDDVVCIRELHFFRLHF